MFRFDDQRHGNGGGGGGGHAGQQSGADLDRVLRGVEKSAASGDVKRQVAALVECGRIVRRTPLPHVVMSVLLALAELFRAPATPNFVRYCAAEVLASMEAHAAPDRLPLLGIHEATSRILAVVESNDPVARALALRTLAALPALSAPRPLVRRAVIVCLDPDGPFAIS